MSNPFQQGTMIYGDYEILKDQKWHCTKCELKSAQAATFRNMKLKGVVFDTDASGNEYKKFSCTTCKRETVYRKIIIPPIVLPSL